MIIWFIIQAITLLRAKQSVLSNYAQTRVVNVSHLEKTRTCCHPIASQLGIRTLSCPLFSSFLFHPFLSYYQCWASFCSIQWYHFVCFPNIVRLSHISALCVCHSLHTELPLHFHTSWLQPLRKAAPAASSQHTPVFHLRNPIVVFFNLSHPSFLSSHPSSFLLLFSSHIMSEYLMCIHCTVLITSMHLT